MALLCIVTLAIIPYNAVGLTEVWLGCVSGAREGSGRKKEVRIRVQKLFGELRLHKGMSPSICPAVYDPVKVCRGTLRSLNLWWLRLVSSRWHVHRLPLNGGRCKIGWRMMSDALV